MHDCLIQPRSHPGVSRGDLSQLSEIYRRVPPRDYLRPPDKSRFNVFPTVTFGSSLVINRFLNLAV